MPKIYLVRHGLSASNLDLEVNRRMPDHKIDLAPEGVRQAAEAGNALAENIMPGERVRLLVSPYARTRQTAQQIQNALTERKIGFDVRENLQLREQSFGLFDGIPDDKLQETFPLEYAHYEKHTKFEGEFFAPMPMGESRARVADRVRGTFGTILRDMRSDRESPVEHMIVVSHGVTIRCFRMEWMHKPWEWTENEPNPDNCSITMIEGSSGNGWMEREIFKGFKHDKKSQQQIREEGHVE